MTTVTVLGAGGYLGTAAVAALSRLPVTLRLVGRSLPAAGRPAHEVRRLRLDQPGAVARAVEGSDVVIHLVADLGGSGAWREDRAGAQSVDVGVLRDLIEFADARPGEPLGVIFASTTALNVASANPTAYERHKRQAELLVRQGTADGVLRGTSLRLPTLYGVSTAGGGAGRGAINALIRQAQHGGPVTLWGDGRNRRNLLHVDDAADAFTAALGTLDRLAGRSWDIGAESGLTLKDLAATLVDLVAAVSGEPAVPLVSVHPPTQAAAHDLCDAVVDPRPFMAVTGWRPIRPLHAALNDTIRTLAATQEVSTLR